MRPILSVSLTLAVGLTLFACTRPAGEPSPDLVATMVAATLTAAPTLPPSPTSPPTATPIITPSPTPTDTATPGPIPSATLPELAPGDPRHGINLASPDYRDDFSSQNTWFGPNFEGAINVWDNERHRATDYITDYSIWWSTTVRNIDAGNLYAEISAEIGDCTNKDGYGLAVRVNGDPLNCGYTLEFSCDGAYRIRKFVEGSVQVLLDWTPSEAIIAGPNIENRMGFLANGGVLFAIANGVVLGQVEDSDFYSGTFGLFTSAMNTPGLTTYFDDFYLWYLQP
jgi:hypothetical protein